MGKVIHFEMTADDVPRATKFYADAFGWEAAEFMEGYNTVKTGPGQGVDGAIMKREFKAQPTIIWMAVEDVDVAAQKVKAAGGTLLNEKQVLPNVGEVMYATDTEGNTIGLIKPNPRQ